MLIKLTADTGTPIIDLKYPANFNVSGHFDVREIHTVFNNSGSVIIDELWFDGVCICTAEFIVDGNTAIGLTCDSFCWMMSFVTEGSLVLKADDLQESIAAKANQYFTLYSPALEAMLNVSGTLKVFTIYLTHQYIKNLLWKYDTAAQFTLPEGVTTMVVNNEPVSARMAAIVAGMLQAGQPDYMRRIFLEAKILELLFMQLEAQSRQNYVSPAGLTDSDIEKLHTAKKLIEANIRSAYSIIELARLARLNDFKLKKGFKQLFGDTVFGYLTRLRMDKAYNMLQSGEHNINEVADAVGYKNAHHFTVAFKRKFGVLPSKINKL